MTSKLTQEWADELAEMWIERHETFSGRNLMRDQSSDAPALPSNVVTPSMVAEFHRRKLREICARRGWPIVNAGRINVVVDVDGLCTLAVRFYDARTMKQIGEDEIGAILQEETL